MKLYLATALQLALIGIAPTAALPAPEADPVRILPHSWGWKITSLEGPGCPDFGQKSELGYDTRTTYGMNTMDGSEIYYAHIAYPWFNTKVDKENPSVHLWCETEIQYTEYGGPPDNKEEANYMLRMHKNGTRIGAVYDLEKDVTATWKFTYYLPDGEELVDTVVVNGPLPPRAHSMEDVFNSPVGKDLEQWNLGKCGSGTLSYRTELYLSAKNGASGKVLSNNYIAEGEQYFYGVQQGYSFDWEKCKK